MSLSTIDKCRGAVTRCSLAVALLLSVATVRADAPQEDVAKILLPDLGTFHQTTAPKPSSIPVKDALLRADEDPTKVDSKSSPSVAAWETEYASPNGDKLLVELVRFQSDSQAYSLLTLTAPRVKDAAVIKSGDVGTASFVRDGAVAFFKGTTFARVANETASNPTSATEFARLLAAGLDKGEDEIPVLVEHLPDFQSAQQHAVYAVNIDTLRENVTNQPVLDVVSFDGGTEAVTANYGQSQLVIVEFTTPQFSIDNDQRIWTRIAELKAKGEPGPTAYRRVGNYSVFVFNAPDEKTANALVEQVKYEQVVQWLGDDPHLAERLQRYFTQTSAGVLVAVLKSSGLSLVLCLAIGGLIGAMLFRHRRAQKAAAYSDAGGSIRLNLDELTEPVKTGRLLKSAEPPEQPSANS
jgi:hypothetical protein